MWTLPSSEVSPVAIGLVSESVHTMQKPSIGFQSFTGIEIHRHFKAESSRQASFFMRRKLIESIGNLEKAVLKLETALTIPKDRELVVEGTIQRFEVTIELFWKTLKRGLEYEGFHPKTPRESLKQAFAIGWLHDEEQWLDMLEQRNITSHNYLEEQLAEDNYEDIKLVAPILRIALEHLKSRYN
jgi:nucleotidyltransferase substrate binding protein (TIGR01987 family)